MRAKLIQFTDDEGDRIEILCSTEEGRPWPATEADLLAAGYVPASQLAEVTAQLEAAEGRVRELEAKFIHLDSVYGWTEVAKPAEPEMCSCGSPPHYPRPREPASPPSPARGYDGMTGFDAVSPPSPEPVNLLAESRGHLMRALSEMQKHSNQFGYSSPFQALRELHMAVESLADELERAQKGAK